MMRGTLDFLRGDGIRGGADADMRRECLETCCGLWTMPGSWVRMD